MAYKTSTTRCRVALIHLHRLRPHQQVLCERLRAEAGRCWTELVRAHVAHRERGVWLTDADLRALTKGGVYRLHSQSIQALGQKLLANVEIAHVLRMQHTAPNLPVDAQYPYKAKPYQCTACHAIMHRDANGAANICSKAVSGRYGQVQPIHTTYRRATDVVVRIPPTQRMLRVAGAA